MIIRKTLTFILLFFLTLCIAQNNYKISIEGIDGKLYKNVASSIIEYRVEHYTVEQIKEKNSTIINQIKIAMQPFGYFHPSIQQQIKEKNGNIYFTFVINHGPRVSFNDIKVEPKLKPYIKNIDLIKKGDYFSVTKYENLKNSIKKNLQNNGYSKASLRNSEVKININENTASLNLNATLGKQYRFGNIIYNYSLIEKSQLMKYKTFKTGEIYNKNKLDEYVESLKKSGLFKSVSAEPIFNDNAAIVEIKISASFFDKNSYQIGIGYDTDQKYRLSFDAKNNYITNAGDKSIFSSKISDTEIQAGYDYIIPGFDPKIETEILSIYFDTQDNIEIGISNYITSSFTREYNYNKYTITKSLNLHYEESEPNNEPIYFSTLIYPSISLSERNKILDNLNYNWTAKIMASIDGVGSNISMLQAQLTSMLRYKISDKINYKAKLNIGGTYTNNFDDVPLSFKFAAGGSNSIRGYDYNSIGPGKFMKVLSNEISYEVFNNISATIFVDIGNATNTFFEGKYYVGTGPGISWNTPIGDANISLSYALSLDGNPWKLQFRFMPKP